jgi:hypothetical protein
MYVATILLKRTFINLKDTYDEVEDWKNCSYRKTALAFTLFYFLFFPAFLAFYVIFLIEFF